MRINKEKCCVEIFNSHFYKVGDEWYPSVTSVLQTINKGYGYNEWLKSVGHNADIILKKAQESGSKIHAAVESLILGDSLNAMDFEEQEWIKLCDFSNWYKDLDIVTEFTELEVYSKELKIAGTLDWIGLINGERWILDFKSGNNIYPISGQQIGIYAPMFNKLYPDKPIQRGGVLHIGAKTKIKKDLNNKGVQLVEHDLNKNHKLFLNTLELFNEYFRTKAPMLEYPMTLDLKIESEKTNGN